MAELEQQLQQPVKTKPSSSREKLEETTCSSEFGKFELRWSLKVTKTPCGTNRWYDAVVCGNIMYIKDQGTLRTYSFDVTNDNWSQLPDCLYLNSSITVMNGWLTTVGGLRGFHNRYTDELFSLTGEDSGRQWTKIFPPMPTMKCRVASLCTGTTLIVAGGQGIRAEYLLTVEVMDTETHQWSTATDLPETFCLGSATVCGDQFYMLGGFNKDCTNVKSVYTCSVRSLLQSCVPSSLEANFDRQTLLGKPSVWRQVSDLSVKHSTCESFNGQLLAIGREMDSGRPTTAVYMYNSTTNSWEIISHMTTARYCCFTAVLPHNQLMVVGGNIGHGPFDFKMTETVEFAEVLASP